MFEDQATVSSKGDIYSFGMTILQHHATLVNIYLPTDRGQVLALSIPFSDIERLSVRPVKWLRFVTFAICGVRTIIFMRYIAVVLQDRLNSYDSAALEPNNLGINSVENGMFLAKNLHSSFVHGRRASIKTPNFALDPADIPRVEAGPMLASRITLHNLAPDTSFHPILQGDARITGTGTSLPSTVILDYMYGVAAYRRWGSGQDIEEVMEQRFSKHYKSIPMPPASPYSSDSDSFSEPDDPNDGNRRPRRRNHSAKLSDGMLRAMDKVLALSMLLKGTTPEMMAAERQRREEAEELCAKEASRVKVQQWMQSSPCVLSYLRAISH
ncbi:hypothetical protein F5887DRAFT_1274000 [Amanita rubescens]|nr:hypothetical protein F5887DRAFT_1274000 [Amanita rubescens]